MVKDTPKVGDKIIVPLDTKIHRRHLGLTGVITKVDNIPKEINTHRGKQTIDNIVYFIDWDYPDDVNTYAEKRMYCQALKSEYFKIVK